MMLTQLVARIDDLLWGPGTLFLLLGTGIFLTLRLRFLPWRNLGFALRCVLSPEARRVKRPGDVSPFSALMTALASTIGTGNIAGVATALIAGGPGALVWMELAALFGLSTKYAECLLSVRFRRKNQRGELCGGPMYVLRDGLGAGRLGAALGACFALSAVCASFGIGSITQSNSIAAALSTSCGIPVGICALITALLSLTVTLGGIRSISAVSTLVVPCMAVFYLAAGLIVIIGNWANIPAGLVQILIGAFSPQAVAGGAAGTALSLWNTIRWGVARGVFSNEAGLGSAAISAASAATDSPVRQGYINMTGAFFDTMVICTLTGLVLCCSGVLGTVDASGQAVNGAALTILAFRSVLGPVGGILISIAITLFAFSTIIGWEFQGEKAFEYLFGTRPLALYRVSFALAAFWGAGEQVELVFRLADICNALMCIPNLCSLLLLSGCIARDTMAFQSTISFKRAKRV